MTAPTVSSRIPIRLAPVRGEAFDGWLDAYAQRLRISAVVLGRALGVPPELLRLRCAKVALANPAPDPERVAARAGGIDPGQVEALWLGLARYDRLVSKRLGTGGRRLDANGLTRAARPLSWSRFCPACLRESAGRWLAAWRLPWYLACLTHETMLASGCPRCGGVQRDRGLRVEPVREQTTLCCHPTGTRGRGDNRCRHDLTADVSAALAPPDLIGLQGDLGAILDPALSDSDVQLLVDRLIDVLAVASHAGLRFAAMTGERLEATSVLAGPLSNAHGVIATPRGAPLRALVTKYPYVAVSPLCSSSHASPALAAALLEHTDPQLRPLDRLRYRSMTGAGRRPEGADPSTRLRAMPLALWPTGRSGYGHQPLRPPTSGSQPPPRCACPGRR